MPLYKATPTRLPDILGMIAAILLWAMTPGATALVVEARLIACAQKDGTYISAACACRMANEPSVTCNGVEQMTTVPTSMPSNVSKVYILRTSLSKLQEGDFEGMEYITALILEGNKISTIHPNTFRNLYRLRNLNIGGNPIKELDPSSQTFQHLPSLNQLFVQDAQLTKVNGFSFFTAISPQQPSKKLLVKMTGNDIQCECNVRALKNWKDALATPAVKEITFENMQCANFGGIEYDDPSLNGNDYGQCSDSSVNLFQSRAVCRVCDRESSNYACKQQDVQECVGAQMVCSESVSWDTVNKRMLISSRCDSYYNCLGETRNNANSCGIGYDTNIKCSFCCLGPTCDNSTIGGRTKDYTYDIRYSRRLKFEPYMTSSKSSPYRAEEKNIVGNVQTILRNIDAGFDVYLDRFEPQKNNYHEVVLRVEATMLSTTAETTVLAQILAKMTANSVLPKGFLDSQMYSPSSLSIGKVSKVSFCPAQVIQSSSGTFFWPQTTVGRTVHAICPNTDPSVVVFAVRACIKDIIGSTKWFNPNYDDCSDDSGPGSTMPGSTMPGSTMPESTTPESTTPSLEELEDTPINEDNVHEVSHNLMEYIANEKSSFTPDKMDKTVNILERIVTTEMLAVDGVPKNVISAVSGLIDVDEKTMRQAQLKKSTNERLLKIIDGVSEKSPLRRNKLSIRAPNIAITAQGIRPTERRDVVMTTGDSEEDVKINVSVRSNSRSGDQTSCIIPVKAIADSLTPAQRQNLKRVTFAAHKNDKLFLVPPSKENTVEQQQADDSTTFFTRGVNSQVIAASIPGVAVRNLKENITMTFLHNNSNSSSPQCVSWKQSLAGGQGDWTEEGCGVVETSNTSTTCGCSHLTNFALLMDVYQEGTGLSDLDKKVLSIISYIGCGISLLALLLTLLTYGFFRKLRRDNPSKILINLCLALFLTNFVFVVGMQDYAFDNNISCKIVAVLLHYLLLASLMWMAVEAFYMYLALILVFKTYFTHFILKCSLVGWGVPFVTVIITLAVDATDNYGFVNSGICWLRNPAFYAVFVAPVCIILIINCLAFGMVVRQLMNMSSGKLNKTDRSSTIQRLRGAIGVIILLGLTWIFAIFAIDSASVVFYYLFAIFNSSQGLFIFIFYCLFKKDVMGHWMKSMPCYDKYKDQSKTSSNSRASATTAGHHGVKYNAKSGSSIDNTLSTDSTNNTRLSSSNVYNTIDDSETEQLNQSSDRPSKSKDLPSPMSTHLLAAPSDPSSPELSHVYGNVPSKHQKSKPSNSPPPPPPPSHTHHLAGSPPKGSNISVISQVKQNNQNAATINPAEIDVDVDSRNGPRVRDLRMQFDKRTSTTSDKEITRI